MTRSILKPISVSYLNSLHTRLHAKEERWRKKGGETFDQLEPSSRSTSPKYLLGCSAMWLSVGDNNRFWNSNRPAFIPSDIAVVGAAETGLWGNNTRNDPSLGAGLLANDSNINKWSDLTHRFDQLWQTLEQRMTRPSVTYSRLERNTMICCCLLSHPSGGWMASCVLKLGSPVVNSSRRSVYLPHVGHVRTFASLVTCALFVCLGRIWQSNPWHFWSL